MLVETTWNEVYDVSETGRFDLAHVWYGIAQKRVKGGYAPKKSAKITLVRKAGCRVISE